jgi:hypothetical protein
MRDEIASPSPLPKIEDFDSVAKFALSDTPPFAIIEEHLGRAAPAAPVKETSALNRSERSSQT